MTRLAIGMLALVLAGLVQADASLVVKRSANSVQATIDRLESIVRDKGFSVVARVDHAAAAAKVGQTLRPTQVVIFGNPAVGTALMQSGQSIGLDLPLRVASWQDADGVVWIGYTDPAHLVGRHGIGDRGAVVDKMTGALDAFTSAAAKAP
ncbi:MAG: DUF302 domain-containing protein [Ectothiorhodospiraceae bacterium]|nr:DUF302 domain-containing protein [Ectothiorhodospiraceae bacterium]